MSRRFGLKQPGKVRLIDDLTGSGVNKTVQSSEAPKPHGVDFIASLVLDILRNNPGEQVLGRTYDFKSAYKQLPIASESLNSAFVAVHNPNTRRPELFQLRAAPFGATRSVFSFLRVVRSIWFLGVSSLGLMWSCFFDDFVTFAREVHVQNTAATVEMLFGLLGWNYATEGGKAEAFAKSFAALGMVIKLEGVPRGFVQFANTDKRANELCVCIQEFIQKGTMTLHDCQRLRGRMQFADGQLFGRLGRLCMKAVTDHSVSKKGKRIEQATADAMRRFAIFLEHSDPRRLQVSTGDTWYIFTDACYEPKSQDWVCGLGGVLVNSAGSLCRFFSISLDDDMRALLGALLGEGLKKTIIFEAELLALVLAFSMWRQFFSAQQVICFIDNNSARDVAISGCGRNECANILVDFLLKLEMDSKSFAWYSRVPTPSNISDDPSRGNTDLLLSMGAVLDSPSSCLRDIVTVLKRRGADKRGSSLLVLDMNACDLRGGYNILLVGWR